jgi:hypothetical protein
MAEPIVILPDPQPSAGTPEELLAVLPHLLGAHPRDMVVIAGLALAGDGGQQLASAAAYTVTPDLSGDVAATVTADHVQHAVTVLPRHGADRIAAVAYLSADRAAMASRLVGHYAAGAGLTVLGQFGADRDVYWYPDHPDIVFPYDADHPVTAPYRARRAPLGDLPSAADLIFRPGDPAYASVQYSAGIARKELAAADGSVPAYLTGTEAITAALAAQRDGRSLSDLETARLAVLLDEDPRLVEIARDMIAAAGRDDTAHLDLWQFVTCLSPDAFAAAPATLMAYAAFRYGNPLLADAALHRVSRDAIEYLPADTLHAQLSYGIPAAFTTGARP